MVSDMKNDWAKEHTASQIDLLLPRDRRKNHILQIHGAYISNIACMHASKNGNFITNKRNKLVPILRTVCIGCPDWWLPAATTPRVRQHPVFEFQTTKKQVSCHWDQKQKATSVGPWAWHTSLLRVLRFWISHVWLCSPHIWSNNSKR